MSTKTTPISEGKQKELASALEAFQQVMCQITGPYADAEKRLLQLAYGKTTKGVTAFNITQDDVEWATEFVEEMVRTIEYMPTELEQAQEEFTEVAEREECKHGEDPEFCDPCYEEEHPDD